MGRLIRISYPPEISGFIDTKSVSTEALEVIDERIKEELEVEYNDLLDTEKILSELSKLLKKGDVCWVDNVSYVTLIPSSINDYLEGISNIIDEVVKKYGTTPSRKRRK